MATKEQLSRWKQEVEGLMKAQPEQTWTIARLSLAYPSQASRVQIDTVAAVGHCPAFLTDVVINDAIGRVEVHATFREFELRGRSSVIGPFAVLLQKGKEAKGLFRQRFADSLWPTHGSWKVPFLLETKLGRLIPRPTDEEVVLKSASPGEYGFPPLGAWFEKWDPIELVQESEPDGPTLAVVQHAMHLMHNIGKDPAVPDFYKH